MAIVLKPNESTRKLVAAITSMVDLLETYNVQPWAKHFRISLGMIKQYDDKGISHIRSAYGGMGSFSDIRIPLRDECCHERQEEIDQLLRTLSNDIYSLCDQIERDLL